MNKSDIVIALDMVVGCFEELGIIYCIGGSVASSAYGIARATMDVDLVAKIETAQVDHLVEALKVDYYVSADMIRNAISRRGSFNLIHLETMIKIDVFVAKDQSYDSKVLSRSHRDALDEESLRKFYFSSPEDIILNKLQWYKKGGRVSEQQWKDVLGVLKVQGSKLDFEYLKSWASRLDISGLLNDSFNDAGIPEST